MSAKFIIAAQSSQTRIGPKVVTGATKMSDWIGAGGRPSAAKTPNAKADIWVLGAR